MESIASTYTRPTRHPDADGRKTAANYYSTALRLSGQPSKGSGKGRSADNRLRCAVSCIPQANYRVRLGPFLPLDDVELDVIAFFQCFVTVQLYRRVVHEHVGTVFPPDESVALGVVKPLHFAFVLSHRLAFLTM